MAVFRVGTFAQNQFTLSRLLAQQAKTTSLTIEASSGMRAQRYSGIATDAKRLVSLEATLVRTNRFVENNKKIESRLQVMENQTSTIFDIASDFRATLLQALSGGNIKDIDLVGIATSRLEQIAGLLNVRDDGQYIFGGTRMDIAPVDLKDLLFTAPPNTYPSQVASILEAGSSNQSFASQGMLLTFDEKKVVSGEAYRLSYDYTDATTANLTVTNTMTGVSETINVAGQLNTLVGNPGDNLSPGQTSAFDFSSIGVTVTIDRNFVRAVDNITTGTLDAAAIGTVTTTTFTSINATGRVPIEAIQALKALGGSVYNPSTGLMTINVANDGATVEFSAAGVDLGDGVGVGTTDRVGTGTVNVVVGGHILATLSYADLAAGGGGAGTFTIDVGKSLVGQSTPAYFQGNTQQLTVRANETTTTSYGITASDKGFERLIRALKLIATTINPATETARLVEAQRVLVQAIDELPNVVSRIGLSRSSLEKTNQTHLNTMLYTEQSVSDIKHVDITETLVRLQAEQIALEASFSTLAQARNLTLLNFL